VNVRTLSEADAPALDAFLTRHRDSSMFLRANARQAGLEYHGAPLQAVYVAAVEDDAVIGVAAHAWNGMVILQAPAHASVLAQACVDLSGRHVKGLTGPARQVREARTAFGLDEAPTALDGNERLYALDLADFRPLAVLATDAIVCRAPQPDEYETLRAWRVAYDIELLGATGTPEERRRAAEFLDRQIAQGNAWVAVENGRLLSLSAFNACLPDIVQLGGIYTPPELRGRGYARVAVAASLMAARDRGVARAVLFTGNPNAERTYHALGFQRVGDYSLVLFR